MNQLIIIRGVSGCGKSTFAKLICNQYFEADMYFSLEGKYKFDANKLGEAHSWCQNQAEDCMKQGYNVCVSNTSTSQSELKPYFKLAETYEYQVHVLVKENYHNGKDIHNVPEDNLIRMESKLRGSIKLR
jgi:predicted kinase